MKKSEVIREYNDEIRDTIVESIVEVARIAIENETVMQEQIYIWSDGETETLWGPEGDNSFLVAKDHEDRQIFYVATVSGRDYGSLFEDYKDQAEDMTDEAILECFLNDTRDWGRDQAQAMIDQAIQNAEWAEPDNDEPDDEE